MQPKDRSCPRLEGGRSSLQLRILCSLSLGVVSIVKDLGFSVFWILGTQGEGGPRAAQIDATPSVAGVFARCPASSSPNLTYMGQEHDAGMNHDSATCSLLQFSARHVMILKHMH